MKIVFNKSFYEKTERMRKLSRNFEDFLSDAGEAQADRYIEIFKTGLKRNLFGLKPLKENTVKQKKSKGYPRPRYPLYGKGVREKNSLTNVFKKVKKGSGKRGRIDIVMRKDMHHSGRLPLDVLLKIHNSGATISRGGRTWRLPPRRASLVALRVFARERYLKRRMGEVGDSITKYIMFKSRDIKLKK